MAQRAPTVPEHPATIDPLKAPAPPRAVTARAAGLVLFLLPVNAYWIIQMGVARNTAHPTTIALFFNCIFILVTLTRPNGLVVAVRPSWALRKGGDLPRWARADSVGPDWGFYDGHDTLYARAPAGLPRLNGLHHGAAVRDAVRQRPDPQAVDRQRAADLPAGLPAAGDHRCAVGCHGLRFLGRVALCVPVRVRGQVPGPARRRGRGPSGGSPARAVSGSWEMNLLWMPLLIA